VKAKIAVTGATGFLGRHIAETLKKEGIDVFSISRSTGYDLRDPAAVARAFRDSKADTVVHLAATVGGIGANMARPGTFFYDNMLMGLNVVETAAKTETKLIQIGTVCSYPKFCPIPFKEEDIWNGYPEETNAPYGIAKKAILVMCQSYRKERGLRFGYLIPTNLFGPGDHFEEGVSHVIPALIKRFLEAKSGKLPKVTCWGTGKATRSFLYAGDAAEAIVKACATLDDDRPVNLSGMEEVSMFVLTKIVAELAGYDGKIEWDPSKPDGQPRRAVDGSRAKELLGWEPRTTLVQGLKETIDWYLKGIKQ
jgi:nucleoside-diphosphate-sugar epimerase